VYVLRHWLPSSSVTLSATIENGVREMMTYIEMVFVPVLLCMGLFAVFGLATL
jgi:hypothetical protein